MHVLKKLPRPLHPRRLAVIGSFLAGALALLLPGSAALAQDPSYPPNVVIVLGSNDSLQDFAVPLPNAGVSTGCDLTNPDLNNTTDPTQPTYNPILVSYNPANPDPKVSGTQPLDVDPDLGQFFDPNKIYATNSYRMLLGTSLSSDFRFTTGDTTTDAACRRFVPSTSSTFNVCKACLADPSRGWFRANASGGVHRWLLSGRILNVLPPKFAAARKGLKDALQYMGSVRFGMSTFGMASSYFYDPPTWVQQLGPSCDRSYPIMDMVTYDSLRYSLKHQINLATFTGPRRPLAEALTGLGGYFSSEKQTRRWTQWFAAITAPVGYPGSSTWTDGGNTWIRAGVPWEGNPPNLSVCWASQRTAVLLISDGLPLRDNTAPVSKMLELLISQGAQHPDGTPVTFTPGANSDPAFDPGGINDCDQLGTTKAACDEAGDEFVGPDTNNKNFADDVAFFLNHMDLRDDYPGQTFVQTHVIGLGFNHPYLQSIARAGGGQFYTAGTADQLRDAVLQAVTQVQAPPAP